MLWIETVSNKLVNLDHVRSINMTHNKGAQSYWSLDAIWHDGSGGTTLLKGGFDQNSDTVYRVYEMLVDEIRYPEADTKRVIDVNVLVDRLAARRMAEREK